MCWKVLTPAQAQAVQAIEGPVLVLAGPGLGQDAGAHPSHRLPHPRLPDQPLSHPSGDLYQQGGQRDGLAPATAIGPQTSRLTIGTFHAICARILRQEATYAGLGSNFVIYDEDDQQRLITRILKEPIWITALSPLGGAECHLQGQE